MNLASEEQAARLFQRMSEMEEQLLGFNETLKFQSNAIANQNEIIANLQKMLADTYTVVYNLRERAEDSGDLG